MYKPVFLGQGAISSLLAAKCQQLALPYAVLGRSAELSVINYSQSDKKLHFTPPGINKSQLTPFHLLVLPVKAYQVQPALQQLSGYLQQVPILLFHNGMGTIEISRQLLPNNPILAGTTNYGALKNKTNSVVQTGEGATNVGWAHCPHTELEQWIVKYFSQLLPPFNWQQEINTALWQKLAINGVINPITAVEQVQNGELLKPVYRALIKNLCTEIARIMQGLGINTNSDELIQKVRQVCAATAENYSSMNRDVFYRRRTEIDFINGYIQQQALSLSLPAETNKMMLAKVKQLEP